MGKARDIYRIFEGKTLVKWLQRRPRWFFNLWTVVTQDWGQTQDLLLVMSDLQDLQPQTAQENHNKVSGIHQVTWVEPLHIYNTS
jgi:hypothetical protein